MGITSKCCYHQMWAKRLTPWFYCKPLLCIEKASSLTVTPAYASCCRFLIVLLRRFRGHLWCVVLCQLSILVMCVFSVFWDSPFSCSDCVRTFLKEEPFIHSVQPVQIMCCPHCLLWPSLQWSRHCPACLQWTSQGSHWLPFLLCCVVVPRHPIQESRTLCTRHCTYK